MSVVSTLLSVTASIFNRGGVWREVANLDLPNNVPRWLSGRAARDFEVSVFETHRPRRRVSARFNNFFRDFCEDPSASGEDVAYVG